MVKKDRFYGLFSLDNYVVDALVKNSDVVIETQKQLCSEASNIKRTGMRVRTAIKSVVDGFFEWLIKG